MFEPTAKTPTEQLRTALRIRLVMRRADAPAAKAPPADAPPLRASPLAESTTAREG